MNKRLVRMYRKLPDILRFFVPRAVVLTAVFAVLAFALDGLGLFAALGATLGAAVSLHRIVLYFRFMENLTGKNTVKGALIYPVLSLTLSFFLLMAAILVNMSLFIGITAGLLFLPFIIFINAITEKLGLTDNHWGLKEEGSFGKRY